MWRDGLSGQRAVYLMRFLGFRVALCPNIERCCSLKLDKRNSSGLFYARRGQEMLSKNASEVVGSSCLTSKLI